MTSPAGYASPYPTTVLSFCIPPSAKPSPSAESYAAPKQRERWLKFVLAGADADFHVPDPAWSGENSYKPFELGGMPEPKTRLVPPS